MLAYPIAQLPEFLLQAAWRLSRHNYTLYGFIELGTEHERNEQPSGVTTADKTSPHA